MKLTRFNKVVTFYFTYVIYELHHYYLIILLLFDYPISCFYNNLNDALKISVPFQIVCSDMGAPWFTPHLRRFRNVKSKLYKILKNAIQR